MAVDKLVDSGKLNAALTYEAGRIRAKTGSATNIAFDFANEKGFGDAIDAIPTGGGATLLASYTVPENVNIVSIDYTSAMDGYDAYIMEIEGTAAEARLYICPQLNTTNVKSYSGFTDAGNAFHKKYWVTPFTSASSLNTAGYMVVIGSNIQQSTTVAITNFVFASYYATSFFAAGTVAKIWGVKL